MNVTCEKCGSSYEMEDRQIPAEGLSLKCPSCLGSFRIHRSPSGTTLPVGSVPDAVDLSGLKIFVRRSTGSVFGPFVGKALEAMARSGKLDGSESLSTDGQSWVGAGEFPGLAHLFTPSGETPAGAIDLPAPVAAPRAHAAPPRPSIAPPQDLGDLPAPVAAPRAHAAPPRPSIAPPQDLGDLPAPVAAPAAHAAPPRPSIAQSQDLGDLPAPVAASKTKAPPRPSITPPSPGLPELPTPRSTPPGGAPRAVFTPPPPDLPDLPTPRSATPGGAPRAVFTPPPPDLPDLPTPRSATPGSAPRAVLTPPPPDLPDLPTPRSATPGSAPRAVLTPPPPDLPDLPTPRSATPGSAPRAVFTPPPPDLPDLPTPRHAGQGQQAGHMDQIDLPTPAESNLPTPRASQEDDGAMRWGELELDRGDGQGAMPGEAPFDLSELDLVAPSGTVGLGSRAQATDFPEGSVALSDPAQAADNAAAPEATAATATTSARSSAESRPSAPTKLLRMPRRLAVAVLGLAGLGVLVAVYFMVRPAKPAPEPPRSAGTTARSQDPEVPASRQTTTTKVAYLSAMDLDTSAAYLKAAKTHGRRAKSNPSASLQAAAAKARLLAVYRYAVPGVEEKARAIVGELASDDDPEVLKARALAALLGGKAKVARSLLKKAAALDKENPEVPLILGWLELGAGRLERAERAFRDALTLRGKSAGARYGLAQTLALKDERGTRDERSKLLAKALELSPLHAQALVAHSELTTSSDPAEAQKALQTLLDKLGSGASPRERGAVERGLAMLALRQGALDKALTLLAAATRAPGADPSLLRAEGLARLRVGDPRTAATRLEEALKAEGGDPRVLEALVRAYLELGELAQAEAAVDAFTARQDTPAPIPRVAPMDDQPREAMPMPRGRGRQRPAAQAPDGAAAEAPARSAAMASAVPSDPWLDVARGRIADARGELDEARRLFLSSTGRKPDFTLGHEAYLALLLRQRQYEGMRTAFELVRSRYADRLPSSLVILEGRMHVGLKKPDVAEKILRAGSERDPGSNELLIELARCLWMNLKKPEEAYLLLEQVARRASVLVAGTRLIAEFHWERKEYERARQRFEEARKVLRTDTLDRAFVELLLRQPTQAHLTRAKALLDPLLEANGRDDESIALGSLVALGEGDVKEAGKRIRRARLLRPKKRGHLIIEARIAAEAGDPRQAILIYDALLKEKPTDIEVLHARARLQCHYRDTTKCIASAQELLSRRADPEAHLLLGQGYLQERKPVKAMRSFRQAISLDRGHAEAHFLLGRTQYDETNFRAAIGTLRQSLDLAEESISWWPDLHYFLGMSYHRVKSARLAATHLKRYLSTKGNPRNPETGAQRRAAEEALKRPLE